MSKKTKIHQGSGNIFADLGRKNADEMYTRAQIGIEVLKILQARKLKQRAIAETLGIRQSEVSHLTRVHFHRFSEGKLLGFLKRLDRRLVLLINRPNHRHEVRVSL
jgi:predicted XRE-type DNA-binding protein